MNQHSDNTIAAPRFEANLLLIVAGLTQIVAAFTPAGRGRLVGVISFAHLPKGAGVAFVVLGILTALVALWRRGWWRWLPGLLSAALLAVIYMRLRWAPSGTFADPLVRRIVHPSWGFYPMGVAILLSLAAPIRLGRRTRPAPVEPAPESVTVELPAVSVLAEATSEGLSAQPVGESLSTEPAPETLRGEPAPESLPAESSHND
jgi:MFS family permease